MRSLLLLALFGCAFAIPTTFPYYLNESIPQILPIDNTSFAFMGGATFDPTFAYQPSICNYHCLNDDCSLRSFADCGQLACKLGSNLTHIFVLDKKAERAKLLSTKIVRPSSPLYRLHLDFTITEDNQLHFSNIPVNFTVAYSPSCASEDRICAIGLCLEEHTPLPIYRRDVIKTSLTTPLLGSCLDSDLYLCDSSESY